MIDFCSGASGCKLDSCIGSVQDRCGTEVIGGIKWVQIAARAAVLDTVWTTDDPKCPLKNLTKFIMNTPTNNPSCGCSDNLFYTLCFDDETTTVNSTWTYNKDDKTTTYNYAVTGEFPITDDNQLCAMENYFTNGKEIVLRWCDNGTGYVWVVGIDGGLCINEIAWDWGQTKQDKKFITLNLGGDVCMNHKRVWDTDVETTSTHLEETSANCLSVEDCAC